MFLSHVDGAAARYEEYGGNSWCVLGVGVLRDNHRTSSAEKNEIFRHFSFDLFVIPGDDQCIPYPAYFYLPLRAIPQTLPPNVITWFESRTAYLDF